MNAAAARPARPDASSPTARKRRPWELDDTRTIRLAELLGALSYALDMTEGQPAGHCVRCCWIGVNIGRELGLPPDDLSTLYYTLLLKDLGCSSNAARICEIYIADDIQLKRDFKRVGDSLPQVLRFVLTHTGLQAGLAERFQAMLNIVQNGGQLATQVIETRCNRGAEIARQMHFSEAVASGILDLDEHWDGNGRPSRKRGNEISLFARIALLAQVVDVFQYGTDPAEARREVRNRSGTWFDPAVAAAFERIAERPSFWDTLRGDRIEQAIFTLAPGQFVQTVDDDYLDDIAVAFASVVDAKTPFTYGHSSRVALFTDMIGKEVGLDPAHRRWLKRAALLHDIGKLGVSNSILDKPGKLTDQEWVAMRGHAAASETILSRIDAFASMAQVVGAHHERLDGKGYPSRIGGDEIANETRIISVADVFDALTAERPYRGPLPAEKAFGIMEEEAGASLDPEFLAALRSAVARLDAPEN